MKNYIMNLFHKKIRIENYGNPPITITKEQVLESNWQLWLATTPTHNYDYVMTIIEDTEFVLYFQENEMFNSLLCFVEYELTEHEYNFLKLKLL